MNPEKTADGSTEINNSRKLQYFCCFKCCRNKRTDTKEKMLEDSTTKSKTSFFRSRTKSSVTEKAKSSITDKSKSSINEGSAEKRKRQSKTLLQRIMRSESKCEEEVDDEITTIIRGALNRGPSRDHLTADYYTAELNSRPECKEAVVQNSQAWRHFYMEKKCGTNRAYRRLREEIEKIIHMKVQENVLDNKSNELVAHTLASIVTYIADNIEDKVSIKVDHEYLREGCDTNIHELAKVEEKALMT